MSDAERDVELLLDRVTPEAIEAPPWDELVEGARRRRTLRQTTIGAAAAVVMVLVVGVVAVALDADDEVRVVDDRAPDTTFGLPSVVEELDLNLDTGFRHVYPPELVGGEVEPYGDPEAVIADFARSMLRWPEPVEVEVLGSERAEVRHPATGRSVALTLGRDDEEGWVIDRVGGALAIDPDTGTPVVERPDGTVAILVADADLSGSGGSGWGVETTPGDPLAVDRREPVDDAAIVVAASYDAQGRVIEIATARDDDLEPPPLRYPFLVLDSLELSGSAGVVDEADPTGVMITMGDFSGDSEFEHAADLYVSAQAPWPGVIFGEVEPEPVEFGGYDADVIVEELTGTRWIQVLGDELTVLIQDGPFAEEIIESMRLPEMGADPDRVRFDTEGSVREVARTPYGTDPTVLLFSEPSDVERTLLITADRGPQFGRAGTFQRIERGVASGGGWLGVLPGGDRQPNALVLTWEATWGTWLSVVASGYTEEQLLELADAIELADRATWEDTYGP